MPRTRIHNMNISLDGYAAGEHVTFDAPIGGAQRLFDWFDGRVIHGVDRVAALITRTAPRQACGARASARRSWGAASSGPTPGRPYR